MPKYIISVKDKPYIFNNDVMTPLDSDKVYEIIEKKTDKRTIVQNSAMHKYFSLVAEALNDAGLDMKQVIKADVQWSMFSVKEYMWKAIQKAVLGKESTTLLKKDEIDVVYENMNRLTASKFGINIPFPSVESMIFTQNYKDK